MKKMPPELTMEQVRYKLNIDQTRKKLRSLEEACRRLVAACPHYFPRDLEDQDDDAVCAVCGVNYGWYCEKSPDHTCHYWLEYDVTGPETPNTKCKMLDGSLVEPPYKWNDGETCMFCEGPDERK